MAVERFNQELSSSQKEFENLLNEDLKTFGVKEGQTVDALVTELTPKYCILDLKYKQEAMINVDEFGKDLEKIKVGDKIPVYVERLETFKNDLIVSYSKAKSMKTWNLLVEKFKSGEEVVATLVSTVRGGYVADCQGLMCFVPKSQLELSPSRSVSHLMGQPLKFIAVRVDSVRGNVALSRKEVLIKTQGKQNKEALEKIKEGDVVEGRVQAVVDWGAFIDLDGLISLLHQSDISHTRVSKVSDVLTLNQKLKVKITKIDRATNRISVSIKDLTASPYENLEKVYKVGSVHKAVVDKHMAYGSFCSIGGVQGLLHNSQISWTEPNPDPSKHLTIGQEISVKIMSVEGETKRISLSLRETTPNPWKELENKVESIVEVTINNVTDKAIFCTLDNGLTGMVHISEVNWNQSDTNLKDFKKGMKISTKIIELKDTKLRLSIRQAGGKDPFSIFKEKKWGVNSIITSKVYEVLKTGIKVSIDPEEKILVMIKKNQLAKQESDARAEIFQKGNRIDAMITELDLNKRLVTLSVKAAEIWQEKSLMAKFGAVGARSGATLAGIFGRALGTKNTKEKKNKKDKEED